MRQRRVFRAIVILSLTIATLAVYARTFGYGYVVLDDAQYVYQNAIVRQGLSRAGAICAFTTFWCANWHANEAEKLARTAGVRILDLVDQGLLESILFNVHRGGGRTEYWIRRESLNRWIATRDLGLAGYMPRAEAQRSLGLKNITCRSPEWCPGEHISGAGAQLDIKTNPCFGSCWPCSLGLEASFGRVMT